MLGDEAMTMRVSRLASIPQAIMTSETSYFEIIVYACMQRSTGVVPSVKSASIVIFALSISR